MRDRRHRALVPLNWLPPFVSAVWLVRAWTAATEWIAPYVACGRRVSYQAREEGRTPYKVQLC